MPYFILEPLILVFADTLSINFSLVSFMLVCYYSPLRKDLPLSFFFSFDYSEVYSRPSVLILPLVSLVPFIFPFCPFGCLFPGSTILSFFK